MTPASALMDVPSFDDDGDARAWAPPAAGRATRDDADARRDDDRARRAREATTSTTARERARREREDGRGGRREDGARRARERDDARARRDEGAAARASGKALGRRRRAAEKRRRLAEAKRAARDDGATEKRARGEERRVAERARATVDDAESSDYDEELLPEPAMAPNEPVSDDASTSASRDARTRAPAATASSAFMKKMRAKLSGGQFRMLNERLYTTTGDEGLALVKDSPELFEAYHAGFRSQVESWPTKPVDVVAGVLKKSPKSWVVADFGCGDAELARVIEQKCHSFDLQTPECAPEVIACNMSDVPLGDASVDCAVFSLSLMGTDYGSFLEEAHRVLKPGGLLWIAEVRSRFDGKNGAASVSSFVAALGALGFRLRRDPDERNTMFFTVELLKTFSSARARDSSSAIRWPPLKACSYKRR